MRILASLMILALLSGCGCKPDAGDDMGISSYWKGCWAAAKREDR